MRIRYSQRQDGSVVASGTGRYDHERHYMTWDPRTKAVWRDDWPRPCGLGLDEHAFHVQVETMLECDEYSLTETPKCVFRLPVPYLTGWAVACGCGHFREHGSNRSSLIRMVYLHHRRVSPHFAEALEGPAA